MATLTRTAAGREACPRCNGRIMKEGTLQSRCPFFPSSTRGPAPRTVCDTRPDAFIRWESLGNSSFLTGYYFHQNSTRKVIFCMSYICNNNNKCPISITVTSVHWPFPKGIFTQEERIPSEVSSLKYCQRDYKPWATDSRERNLFVPRGPLYFMETTAVHN